MLSKDKNSFFVGWDLKKSLSLSIFMFVIILFQFISYDRLLRWQCGDVAGVVF